MQETTEGCEGRRVEGKSFESVEVYINSLGVSIHPVAILTSIYIAYAVSRQRSRRKSEQACRGRAKKRTRGSYRGLRTRGIEGSIQKGKAEEWERTKSLPEGWTFHPRITSTLSEGLHTFNITFRYGTEVGRFMTSRYIRCRLFPAFLSHTLFLLYIYTHSLPLFASLCYLPHRKSTRWNSLYGVRRELATFYTFTRVHVYEDKKC